MIQFYIIRHVPDYLVPDDSTCSKLSRSALPIDPATSAKLTSLYPLLGRIFNKHISTLSSSLVAREPPIMTLDRLTGPLKRDTKSPRGKLFLNHDILNHDIR